MSTREQQEFRVVIEGLELESEQLAQLNTAVQKAVLIEIARLKIYSDFAVHLPKDWIGLLVRPQALLD